MRLEASFLSGFHPFVATWMQRASRLDDGLGRRGMTGHRLAFVKAQLYDAFYGGVLLRHALPADFDESWKASCAYD